VFDIPSNDSQYLLYQSQFEYFAQDLVNFHYQCANLSPPSLVVCKDPAEFEEVTSVYTQNIHSKIWRALIEKVIKPNLEAAFHYCGKEEYNSVQEKIFKHWQYRANELQEIVNQKDKKQSHRKLSHQLSAYDLDALMLMKYFEQGQSFYNPMGKRYLSVYKQGVYNSYLTEKVAFVCPMPIHVYKNENSELHHESMPAVEWSATFKAYYYKGISVPEKLILEPENFDAQDIMRIHNAEVRRCVMEHLGSQRFATLLDLEEKDRITDPSGNEMFLLRTRKPDPVAREHIQFAQVVCPSTMRVYFLCVPPDINKVTEAVAWTFGKKANEYRPEIET